MACGGCAHPHRDIAGASSAYFPAGHNKPHQHKHRQHRPRCKTSPSSPPKVYTNAMHPCCKPCSPRHGLASKKRRGVQGILSSSNLMQLPTAQCYIHRYTVTYSEYITRVLHFSFPRKTGLSVWSSILVFALLTSCVDSRLPQLTPKTLCIPPSKARKPLPHSLHAALAPRRYAH